MLIQRSSTYENFIGVLPDNADPVLLTEISDVTTDEDAEFTLDISNHFADENTEDVLTYSATLADGSALPAWLSFDSATGIFSGTPLNDDVSNFDVKVTADDGNGGTKATDNFTLTVNNTNDAPELISTLPDFVLAPSESFSLDLSAYFTDIDAGDTLSYNSTNISGLTLNNETGLLSGEVVETGSFELSVTATDLSGAFISDSVTLDVANFTNTGTSGADSIAGANDPIIYHGLTGNDTIDGGNNLDTLFGGMGEDVIYGGNSKDDIYGGSGNDFIQGNEGTDIIYGGAGSDTIRGGKGSDTINGGSGDDIMYGDWGSELFIFDLNSGNDTLINFKLENDVADVSAYGFASADGVLANITYTATDAILHLDDNNSITMLDISESDLWKADFFI